MLPGQMTERSTGLSRAQADIEAGRLWKARDRLHGVFVSRPGDQSVLELLGEVHFLMGDLPQAARFWMLTERSGPDVDAAIAAFEERYARDPGSALVALPIKVSISQYPPDVRNRIEAMSSRADETKPRKRPRRFPEPEPGSLRETLIMAGLVLVTFGIWVVGVIWLIALVWRLIFGD